MKWAQAGVLWGMFFGMVMSARADTTWVAAGSVSGNWNQAGSPYMVSEGSIEVTPDSTLSIGPGVQVYFAGPFLMVVHGSLYAVGTEQDSIYFTAALADTAEWAWRGIFLETLGYDTGEVTLRYCVFEHANGPGALPETGGALQAWGACGFIDNCSFRHNRSVRNRNLQAVSRRGGAMYLYQSCLRVDSCHFVENYAGPLGLGGAVFCETGPWNPVFTDCIMRYDTAGGGGGIAVHGMVDYSFPRFSRCDISHNVALFEGGGVHVDSCNAHLDTCTIGHNVSGQSGGGVYAYQENESRLTGCSVYNNASYWGGGVYSGFNANFSMWNSTVWNNVAGYGGGVYLYQTWSGFYHCTIAFNTATQGSGGGMFVNESPALISNTIVSYSSAGEGVYFWKSPAAVIWYCDFGENASGPFGSGGNGHMPPGLGVISMINANGDSCDNHRNIVLDPSFTDGSYGDFSLNWNSPCIDAGDPITGQDPDGTLPDIGAFYRDATSVDPERTAVRHYELAQNYPNPFNAVTEIEFELPRMSEAELAVYDLTGRLVATLLSGRLNEGHHQVRWDAAGLPSGVYLYRLRAGDTEQIRKMVLLK